MSYQTVEEVRFSVPTLIEGSEVEVRVTAEVTVTCQPGIYHGPPELCYEDEFADEVKLVHAEYRTGLMAHRELCDHEKIVALIGEGELASRWAELVEQAIEKADW